MSHASAALPLFPLPDFPTAREARRRALAVLSGLGQAACLAAVLWLFAAGPGLLSDAASTVPVAAASSR